MRGKLSVTLFDMRALLIKALIRLRFALTSRARAQRQTEKVLSQYQELIQQAKPHTGKQGITVPPMRGVDEDMRQWSFFMILEHNTIVNQSISALVQQLAHGQEPHGAATISPKHDVMPSAAPGPEQIEPFLESIKNHLHIAPQLPALRSTATRIHPIFGHLNAHGWHCLFPFHLSLHLNQAQYVLQAANQ